MAPAVVALWCAWPNTALPAVPGIKICRDLVEH
jgi:hypothetical protein